MVRVSLVVRRKVYKNIKLKNLTKQPFLLKVRYKEQRSENMTPFTSHSGLRNSKSVGSCN